MVSGTKEVCNNNWELEGLGGQAFQWKNFQAWGKEMEDKESLGTEMMLRI